LLDYMGKEMSVGDTVVFVAPKYRHFAKATITKITEKTVFLEYMNTWNYGGDGYKKSCKQSGDQVIKC